MTPEAKEAAFRAHTEQVSRLLSRRRFLVQDEARLQALLAETLTAAGYAVEREVVLEEAGRVDILLTLPPGGQPGQDEAMKVGLEVKIKGELSAVTRQLFRYAGVPALAGVILVTTRHTHARQPMHMQGTPLSVIILAGGLL